MKTLTLLRHAKSGWDDQVTRDFDRPLNAKGRRAAVTVGAHLRSEGLAFDRDVSSPAVRCIDTLDGVWEGYAHILHPNWDRRVYLASGATLLDVVQDQPDASSNLLFCGHNPGLEDLVLALVPDNSEEALREDVEEKLPTGSIVQLEFAVDRWRDIATNGAHLARFVRPRDLDPALGPDVA